VQQLFIVSIGCDVENVPAAVSISIILAQYRSGIPSEVIFRSRDVLFHQVVDEFAGAMITHSHEEQVLASNRVPTYRPSAKAVSFEELRWRASCANKASVA
jgi:hypothetical protein